jgi:hypothetical protein
MKGWCSRDRAKALWKRAPGGLIDLELRDHRRGAGTRLFLVGELRIRVARLRDDSRQKNARLGAGRSLFQHHAIRQRNS